MKTLLEMESTTESLSLNIYLIVYHQISKKVHLFLALFEHKIRKLSSSNKCICFSSQFASQINEA